MFLSDRVKISSERVFTDEGYLQVPARIARSGIYDYTALDLGLTDRPSDEIIKVFRPDEEVFNQDSMASFANKPVTNEHPPELVDVSNYKEYSVGQAGHDIVKDGQYVKADLQITDAEAINRIKAGGVELSNGYKCEVSMKEGVAPNGENYQAIQSNIVGNHIAIVSRGRAGSACRVADNIFNIHKDNLMKVTIDGVEFEASDQVVQAVGKLQKRLVDAEANAEEKEDEMEEKEKDSKKSEDSLQAKLDSTQAKLDEALNVDIDQLVTDRTSLLATAKKVSPKIDFTGMDSNAVKSAVIQDKVADIDISTKSDDYINARFDALVDTVKVGRDQNGNLLDQHFKDSANPDIKKDAELNVVDAARAKMMERNRNLYKGVQA